MKHFKKVGIIGAMEVEVEGLKKNLLAKTVTRKAGMEFWEGKLSGKDVVVVRSGIGKVNAAACTQILIDLFAVDCVLNTGVAGSLDSKIDIGDIVVSTDSAHHDMNATVFGYALGHVPQMDVHFFPADERLVEAAVEACKKANPDIQVLKGRVVSGDQFIESAEKKEELILEFAASCTEMEGASIAHTAWINNIPYVVIRAISDKADGSAVMDYPEFEAKAAVHSLRLVEVMMGLL